MPLVCTHAAYIFPARQMSVVLTFAKSTGQRISKGPFSAVVFEGEQICDGQTKTVIATHLPHGWTVEGQDYLRLDVEGPVGVRWEGHAPDTATNGHFSCVNGVAYIDRRILAFVGREQNDWYFLREGQHHPFSSIESA